MLYQSSARNLMGKHGILSKFWVFVIVGGFLVKESILSMLCATVIKTQTLVLTDFVGFEHFFI